ncbi:unnamed protein product [Cunninghamella blakesleeana]
MSTPIKVSMTIKSLEIKLVLKLTSTKLHTVVDKTESVLIGNTKFIIDPHIGLIDYPTNLMTSNH